MDIDITEHHVVVAIVVVVVVMIISSCSNSSTICTYIRYHLIYAYTHFPNVLYFHQRLL
jgi:hypothetical protein